MIGFVPKTRKNYKSAENEAQLKSLIKRQVLKDDFVAWSLSLDTVSLSRFIEQKRASLCNNENRALEGLLEGCTKIFALKLCKELN